MENIEGETMILRSHEGIDSTQNLLHKAVHKAILVILISSRWRM